MSLSTSDREEHLSFGSSQPIFCRSSLTSHAGTQHPHATRMRHCARRTGGHAVVRHSPGRRSGGAHGGRPRKPTPHCAVRPTAKSAGRGATCEIRSADVRRFSCGSRRGAAPPAATLAVAAPFATGPASARAARIGDRAAEVGAPPVRPAPRDAARRAWPETANSQDARRRLAVAGARAEGVLRPSGSVTASAGFLNAARQGRTWVLRPGQSPR
jgi:hypothetical protein